MLDDQGVALDERGLMGCRIGKAVVFGAIVAGLWGESVWAQQAAMCHGGDTATEISTPEKLPTPVKMTGIGNSSMKIEAKDEETKAWFTQGLNLLHDFWDYEAEKAFEQAVRTDPKCAMCYWGLYQAGVFRSSDVPWAQAALDRAVALKKHGSKADRLYIEAAVVEHKAALEDLHAKPEVKKKPAPVDGAPHVDSEETKLYRSVVAMKPEDVQARIFLASSLRDGFDKKGEPRAGTAEGQQILVEILKEHPDDTAANHYWIHAVEPGNHPELALESAKKLGELTPASGHMVHMPGHIFYRTGDYEMARESFLASMQVDETYMRTQGVGVANDWNYVHNLMYLIADLMEAGRVTEAMKTSEKLTKARGEVGPTLYRQTPRDGMSRLSVELPVLLRAGVWESAVQALENSSSDPSLKNLAELREAMLEYTRGMAALEHGDSKAAAAMSDALDARVKQKPIQAPEDMPGMAAMSMSKDAMAKPVHSYLDVAAMELRASVLLGEGRGVESDTMFTKAAEAEKELGYREPPFYIRPVEETRGDALLRAKRYDEAKQAYETELKQRPESGFALFGVAQADAGANRRSAATADYAHLLTVWAKADSDLPQLETARAWMARQAADGE
jgi:tetratricopeptide (TPR) repeat protein